ncbi:MAG: PA domain-containing protein [Crocinitomicaceae bacterium]
MKKFLLFVSLSLFAVVGSAQVIFHVENPSPNEGNYDFTYAEGPGWGVADLTDPLNAVQGNMVLVDDGSAGDSLACGALVNGASISGNIAVCYRGSCEFGTKALNCQTAGAIGVIIINNLGGSPVAMGAGADGGGVTIPVVMISNVDGALLRPEIDGGATPVFIGSKSGLYADDLGARQGDALRAESFGVLSMLAQDNTEFEVELGSWVRNYGSADQTNMILNCQIELNSTIIYDETSAGQTLISGDSVFVPLPTFSEPSYGEGYYSVTYTISADNADEDLFDNVSEADFYISDSLYSLGHLNAGDGSPINNTNQYNGGSYLETCLYFNDPNASRMAITGMTLSAGTSQNPTPTSIDGEFVEIYAYEWTDVFTDINNYDFTNVTLNPITNGEYIYIGDLQSQNVYIPFDDNVVLQDGQKYLFCANFIGGVYPGYDTEVGYEENLNIYLQPLNMLRIDNTAPWYPAGYGTDNAPAMSVHMVDAATVGFVEEEKEELYPYPNPASEFITIPLGANYDNIVLTVTDMQGRDVINKEIGMQGSKLKVDVTSLSGGVYVFNLAHDGGVEIFTVNVTK